MDSYAVKHVNFLLSSLNLFKVLKVTVFILLMIGTIFISLLFYTFETLLCFGAIYLISIPISFFVYRNKKNTLEATDDEHEDVL